MKLKGRAYKFGNDINTDEIIPARHLTSTDPEFLGRHCMEDADPGFVKKVKKGDIIVGGRNFGCGSSREHAPISIKGCGVSCVIAESFARIFYRNSINVGLPIFESKEASSEIKEADEIEIDMKTGIIKNLTRQKEYKSQAFPNFMQKIIEAGGLMKHIKYRSDRKCTR